MFARRRARPPRAERTRRAFAELRDARDTHGPSDGPLVRRPARHAFAARSRAREVALRAGEARHVLC